MKLNWLLFDHFPPGLELSPEVRAGVRKLARQHRAIDPGFMNARRSGALFITVWITVISMTYVGLTLLPIFSGLIPKGGPTQLIGQFVGMLLMQGGIWIVIALGARRSSAPYYRQALCDLGYPVCTRCGYLLRGLSGHARCPECGNDLVWLDKSAAPAAAESPAHTNPSTQ